LSSRISLPLWVSLLTVSLLAVGCSSSPKRSPATAQNGDRRPAANFSLKDANGAQVGLADYKGKVVLLNFWATWCPPCRREIPLFIELQERYGKQGLQIIGIAVDNPEAVARYWQEMHINYPLLLADETTYELMAAYGNRQGGLPYSVLITADGRIAGVKIGAYAREELELALKSHLTATKSSSP